MTLTLTADPDLARVTIAGTALTLGTKTLRRDDVNGEHLVLRRAGHGGGTTITIVDQDPARYGLIRYTLVTTEAGTDTVLATERATITMPPATSGPILHLPVLPQHRVTAAAVTDLAPTVRARYTAHEVIGRTDPVLTLARAHPVTGRLTLRMRDAATAYAALALYARGDVALLRLTEAGGARDLWHLAESADATPQHTTTTGRWWDVTVSYLQVPAPSAGGQLGEMTWTFEDVAAAHTFNGVDNNYADLDAVAVGPL